MECDEAKKSDFLLGNKSRLVQYQTCGDVILLPFEVHEGVSEWTIF